MSKVKYEFEEYRVEKRPLGYVVTDCDDMLALGLNHKGNAELVAKVLNGDYNNEISNAVEQKHGRWIKCLYGDYKCSNCGGMENTVDEFEQPLYDDAMDFHDANRFCRLCGAKMDGDGE